MKKIFVLSLFVFLLISCQQSINLSEYVKAAKIDFTQEGDTLNSVTGDLIFFHNTYNGKEIYTWESSNQEVVTNDGKVTRTHEDVTLTIFCTVKVNNTQSQKSFIIVVLKLDEELFTVKFYSDNNLVNSILLSDGSLASSYLATKNGYQLLGYKIIGYSELFDFSTPITSNLDLEAVWNKVEYSINYILGGKDNNPLNKTKYSIEDLPLTLYPITLEGYEFLGYRVGSPDSEVIINSLDSLDYGNLNLYPYLEPISITITFNYDGGTVGEVNKTVIYNTQYGFLPAPSKEGKTFKGWYLEDEYINQITETTIVSLLTNQEVYAKWGSEEYTITYVLEGIENNPLNKIIYTIEDLPLSLYPISKDGYSFIGFSINSSEDPIIFEIEVGTAGNIILYPQFNKETYLVTFNYNDGEILIESKSVDYNNTFGTLPQPTRTNYIFGGWYLENTFINKVTETTIFNSSTDIVLYANWLFSSYYSDAQNLKGEILLNTLRTIVNSNFLPMSYGNVRYALEVVDRLPGTEYVLGIYDGRLINYVWDGSRYTREHVWPNSRLGVSSVDNNKVNIASDLHNLRAIHQPTNSSRSNRYYDNKIGYTFKQTTKASDIPYYYDEVSCGTLGSDAWYAGDEFRGDVARIILYMFVKWNTLKLANENLNDLTATNYTLEGAVMGKLSTLLEWNLLDPVDEFEIRRNEGIFSLQRNRNPFIDYPELANMIFDTYLPNNNGVYVSLSTGDIYIIQLNIQKEIIVNEIKYYI